MATERRGFRIVGRVQGVGFRWWTCEEGVRLGLSGAVMNREDGSVEVAAEGPPEVLDVFAQQLLSGPPAAVVERVETVEPVLPFGRHGFEIVR